MNLILQTEFPKVNFIFFPFKLNCDVKLRQKQNSVLLSIQSRKSNKRFFEVF